ncbi:MAG: hypothetical protein JW731_08830 [Bacteroidales bacterium]|nr:hypothetical protein [Bacteroidales bacterium]
MKKLFPILLLFLFLVPFTFNLYAQGDPLLRLEIETKSDAATYKVESCGEAGLALFYETTLKQDVYKFWVFVLYNKFMQETWKKDVPIFDNMTYRKDLVKDNFLFVLFYNSDKRKSEQYNCQVLKINLTDGMYELFSGLLPENSQVVAFDTFNENMVVGLNVQEKYSALYTMNTLSKETKPLFNVEDFESQFVSLMEDTAKNSLFAIFNIYESRTVYYMLIKEFNADLSEINAFKLVPQDERKFNSAKLTTVSENEYMVIGTYDFVKKGTVSSNDYFSKTASGFYSAKIFGSSVVSAKYFNFLELENMTGYLRSKEYHQAKKKADKDEDEVDKYSVDFDLLLHDIVFRDSLYYFVAEAFYEEYHTVTSTYYDYYGHAVPVSYAVFDGYKYFNAFISCFDLDGNKIWDNGMEIFNILTFKLENRVSVLFEEDEIIMAYNREGKIGAKIIRGPDVVEGVEYYPLETTFVNDKVMEDTKSNMEYWYDNYFIAYGFQTIKNNSLVDGSKRTVFYINKVAFK